MGAPEKLLARVHWIALIAASMLVGPFFASQAWLAESGILRRTVIDSIPWSLAIASIPVLLAVAVMGMWMHRRRGPTSGALVTAAWALLALAVFRHGFVRTADPMAAVEPTAAEIASIIGDAPLWELREEGHNLVHHQFLFYLRRTIPPVFAHRLARRLGRSDGDVFIMTPATDTARDTMDAMGCAYVGAFEDKPGQARQLWRYRASAPVPSGEPESR
jgi:hypothetical protein